MGESARDASGSLVYRADKFPRGIKFLADYAHAKGLKFGIYSAHGSQTCVGRAGSYGHERQDADLFASWGVDYLKYDSCGGYPQNYTPMAEQWREFAAMRDALNATGRPIFYSICEINDLPPVWAPAQQSPSRCGHNASYNVLKWQMMDAAQRSRYDPRGLANSFLVEWVNNNNHFNDRNCSGWLNNLDSQQDLTLDELSGPGHWNDNDMLSVGCNNASGSGSEPASAKNSPCGGHQTLDEQRSHFALWAMQASPLILGNDVRYMTDAIRNIITNSEIIALNQDALGHRARIAYQSDPHARTLTIFVKNLASQRVPRAASLFNRGEAPASMALTRDMLQLPEDAACACLAFRDLDKHQELQSNVTSRDVVLEATVPPHAALTVSVTCCGKESVVIV